MLESLRMAAVFQQGRRYVRAGQVRSLTISTSVVTGLIVDDDGDTHRARVGVRAYSAADWRRIERALAGEALYLARLLAGDLPEDLDRLLAGYGLSLLPTDLTEIALECSCPDWKRPCGHLAATCYALAEQFDADPFGILAWRGRGRTELLDNLRELRVAPLPAIATKPQPLLLPPTAGFWTAGPRLEPPLDQVAGSVRRPDAVLEQLEPLGLSAGRFEVTDVLAAVYHRLASGG
ncbi:SWIM zinc finger family protein [Virgisporangium aurantiacum]